MVFNLLIIAIFFYSCGTVAPLVERDLARTSIDQAREVNAEVHAGKELSDSEASYDRGQELIEPEKKSTSNKKALGEYLNAIASAQSAYSNSVGPYTKNIIDGFDDTLMEANEEYNLEVNAASLFDDASAKLDDANSSYDAEDYLPVPDIVAEGEMILEEATEEVGLLKGRAESAVGDFAAKLRQALDQHKIDRAVPDLFDLVADDSDSAVDDYEASRYLPAIDTLAEADRKLENAISEAMLLEMEVARQNEEIEALIRQAVARKAQAATPDEYDRNLSTYSSIKSQNSEGYYRKSLEEYSLLKDDFQDMFEIIEEKRLLASEAISEAESRIEEVQEQNTELEQELEN